MEFLFWKELLLFFYRRNHVIQIIYDNLLVCWSHILIGDDYFFPFSEGFLDFLIRIDLFSFCEIELLEACIDIFENFISLKLVCFGDVWVDFFFYAFFFLFWEGLIWSRRGIFWRCLDWFLLRSIYLWWCICIWVWSSSCGCYWICWCCARLFWCHWCWLREKRRLNRRLFLLFLLCSCFRGCICSCLSCWLVSGCCKNPKRSDKKSENDDEDFCSGFHDWENTYE